MTSMSTSYETGLQIGTELRGRYTHLQGEFWDGVRSGIGMPADQISYRLHGEMAALRMVLQQPSQPRLGVSGRVWGPLNHELFVEGFLRTKYVPFRSAKLSAWLVAAIEQATDQPYTTDDLDRLLPLADTGYAWAQTVIAQIEDEDRDHDGGVITLGLGRAGSLEQAVAAAGLRYEIIERYGFVQGHEILSRVRLD